MGSTVGMAEITLQVAGPLGVMAIVGAVVIVGVGVKEGIGVSVVVAVAGIAVGIGVGVSVGGTAHADKTRAAVNTMRITDFCIAISLLDPIYYAPWIIFLAQPGAEWIVPFPGFGWRR